MRQRTGSHLTDTATIERWAENIEEETEDNDGLFPETETTAANEGDWGPVAEYVACRYSPESTEFVRLDEGTRVRIPGELIFDDVSLDIQEDDKLTLADVPGTFEVVGITDIRDHRRGRTNALRIEIEER